MKAKDIALLCAGAVSAGVVTAGAVISAGNKDKDTSKKARPSKAAENRRMPKAVEAPSVAALAEEAKPYQVNMISFPVEEAEDITVPCLNVNGDRLTAVMSDGKNYRCFAFSPDKGISEIRCPLRVRSVAYAEGCTLYITDKGGIFVYDDPEKEPVLKEFCNAEKVFAAGDLFNIYSDGLMYIAGADGETMKTVSLSGMFDLAEGDVCDAENSDDSFALAAVSVKRSVSLNRTFTAAVLDDGRSFLLHKEDDFHICEPAYENIEDVCVFGNYAYYLTKNNMLIKMKISSDKCETAGKYSLGEEKAQPVSITAVSCGLVITYSDGSVRAILPEITGEKKKSSCRERLRRLNVTLTSPELCGGTLSSSADSDHLYVVSEHGRAFVIHIS